MSKHNNTQYENASSLVIDALRSFFGDKFDSIRLLLRKNCAIITGSLIPLAATGQTSGWNDIDIFFNVSCRFQADKIIDEVISIFGEKNVSINNRENSYPSGVFSEANIINVYTFYSPNIQLIFCVNHNSVEDVIHTFDLDVCKNYYNGYQVYFYNLDGILKREMNVDIIDSGDNSSERFINRVYKYKRRGFKIVGMKLKIETKFEVPLRVKIEDALLSTFVDCTEVRKLIHEVKKIQDGNGNGIAKEKSLTRQIVDVKCKLSEENMLYNRNYDNMLILIDELEVLSERLKSTLKQNGLIYSIYEKFFTLYTTYQHDVDIDLLEMIEHCIV